MSARTVVHYSDAEAFGGTEQVLLQLVAHLDRSRWRSVLLHHPAAPRALVGGARDLGIETHAAPHVARLADAARLPALVRAIRAPAPSVFHAHQTWPLSCKLALAAAAAARVPAVVATVQLFLDPRRHARLGALQHRVMSAAVDRFVPVSRAVAAHLRALGVPERRLTVVRNAIDVDRYAARPDAAGCAALRAELSGGRAGPVVLTVARLESQKALDVLIDAAMEAPAGATFVIAGEGPDRASLEAHARARGVADRVRFLGARDDVPALLAAADVFVLPSLHEGLPLAVLEAMAAGLPVVATDVDGTAEAVVDGETGLLVPPRDPAALAAALRRLADDRALAARLAARGRERARAEFRAETIARHVVAIYDELLAGRPDGGTGAARAG